MDIVTFVEIAVAVLVVYFLIKFIVSPILKIVVGIISILVIVFLLQRFFGFNIDNVLAPLGINLNLNSWISKFNWIFAPFNGYIDQAKGFISFISSNIPKFK